MDTCGQLITVGIGSKLDAINETLERHNAIAQKTLGVLQKPENRFIGTLKTIVLIVGILGILNTAELIGRWISGG